MPRNPETQTVFNWLTSDAGSIHYWAQAAKDVHAEAEDTPPHSKADNARYALAAKLKDEVLSGDPLPGGNLYSELLRGALSSVNWDELAEAFLVGDVPEYQGSE